MDFSETVQWWEEWQLRILVLSSLFIRYFLFLTAALRKHRIPAWFRFLIWLAYIGSDAVAIYALAILYNRQKKQEQEQVPLLTPSRSTDLQMLWTPILLLHLGGQSGITAYNIEDNELWRRHVLTAVSQVSIAIYVLFKSSTNDLEILKAAFLLSIYGTLKCLWKPWDLKRVSINSLVDSCASEEKGEISSLHEYLGAAVQIFQPRGLFRFRREAGSDDTEFKRLYGLFVDLAPAYSDRLSFVKHMVRNPDKAHHLVQCGLSSAFNRLYTKESLHPFGSTLRRVLATNLLLGIGTALYYLIRSQEAQDNNTNTNITYALLILTFILELLMPIVISLDITAWLSRRRKTDHRVVNGLWSDQVSQYNLIGYLARNKKHRNLTKLATLLVCKDFLDQLWCMKPCKSSYNITELIHGHIKVGWEQINGITTYHRFNDNRGQWTLDREGLLATVLVGA
ncbi:unnamed protein product [Urochloa humidicola]